MSDPDNIDISHPDEHAFIYGPFSRGDAHYDETSCIAELFSERTSGFLIDVGAHRGGALFPFLELGWHVLAFEPDKENRAILFDRLEKHPLKDSVVVDDRCVTDKTTHSQAFYTSSQSSGISGLTAFHESHEQSQRVDTVSLTDYFEHEKLAHIDFLKIDTEGHDLFVLEGFPWLKAKPEVVECEFENAKTEGLGYKFEDIANFLSHKGYVVYVSEWHPIVEYGIQHDWLGLKKYPCELNSASAWGNLLAFKSDPGEEQLSLAIDQTVKRSEKKAALSPNQDANTETKIVDEHQQSFAERLQKKNLTIFRALQFVLWVLRFLKRHPVVSLLSIATLAFLFLAPVMEPKLATYATYLWASGFLSLGGLLAMMGVSFVHARLNNLTTREAEKRDVFANNLNRLIDKLRSQQENANIKAREELESETNTLRHQIQDVRKELTALYTAHTTSLQSQQSNLQVSLRELQQQQADTNDQQTMLVEEHVNLSKTIGDLQVQSKETFSQLNSDIADQSSEIQLLRHTRHLHNRVLTQDDINTLVDFGSNQLGIDLTAPVISYMAERVVVIEQRCRGRIATPIENMMLRILCALSLESRKPKILEIGTLFGIGLAAIYDTVVPRFENVHLTAIDPLDGYYGNQTLDILTGEAVNETLLRENMKFAGVPNDAFTLVPKLSTDPSVVEDLESKHFDLLIIDGDHTYDGVKFDFELTHDVVVDGGLILFDDYDVPEWPEVKAYVDEIVMENADLAFVGATSRTAVFRKLPIEKFG